MNRIVPPPDSSPSATNRIFALACLSVSLVGFVSGCTTTSTLAIARTDDAITARAPGGTTLFSYLLRRPEGTDLVVDSGGFFHPLTTPKGINVTDLAPSDHLHHRGVFLGWVEMHGAKDADFWGWGEHAPIKDRRIVNRGPYGVRAAGDRVSFHVLNDWMAEDEVLIEEKLEAMERVSEAANVLDVVYTLTPRSDITLAQWAFSGFCVRFRKDAHILGIHSPDGVAPFPDPSHLKPETDWPDAAWYAFSEKLNSGETIGAAVMNHPDNPPSLWHNNRGVRMLNPCIVAPSEVRLEAGKALVLQYRVVTFDGPVPARTLDRLAAEFFED